MNNESKEKRYYLTLASSAGEGYCPNLGKESFASIEEALAGIEGMDPEDDRILVWEVLPSGHRKVVWQCSGWHWEDDASDIEPGGLEQSSLPGHSKSLYEEMIENY